MDYNKSNNVYNKNEIDSFSSKEKFYKQTENNQSGQKNKSLIKKVKDNKTTFALTVFGILALNLIISLGLSYNIYNIGANNINNQNNLGGITLVSQQNPAELNSKDLFIKAIDNLNKSQNYTIKTKGDIKSIVSQKLNIVRTFNGKTHYSENIATGFKNIANKMIYENNKVTMKRGVEKNNQIVFNGAETNYTKKEFYDKFGTYPETIIPYHVNHITITNSSKPEKLANGNYSFNIELHPKISTYEYAKNIQAVSKLKSLPEFSSVKLNVVINDKNEFVSAHINEVYTVKILGVTGTCNSNINVTFDFNTKVK